MRACVWAFLATVSCSTVFSIPVGAAETIGNNADFPGSWKQSCTDGVLLASILSAKCYRSAGGFSETQLDVRTCAEPATAGNNDGQLVCESGVGGGGIGDDNSPAGPVTAEPLDDVGGEKFSCNQRDYLKSGTSGSKVALSFHNAGDSPRKLDWIDYDGKNVLYATIAPGATYDQQTFASHLWELTDEAGDCKLIIKAHEVGETVEVP